MWDGTKFTTKWEPKSNNTNWHRVWNGTDHKNLNYHWLGRVSMLDYLEHSSSVEEARTRSVDNAIHTLIDAILLYIFVRNTWCSIRLLRHTPRGIANWCCFLQAACGLVYVTLTLSSVLGSAVANCKVCVWTENFGITISSICVTMCLLIKAYAVQMRDRRVIYLGVFFIAMQLVYPWLFWKQVIFFKDVSARCGVNYGPYFAWYRFGVELLISLVFSTLFLRTVIRQYRIFGSGCWQKLRSDGLVYILAVTLANVICIITATLLASTSLPKSFLVIDWVVTSLLLVRQNQRMQTVFVNNHPVTRKYSVFAEFTNKPASLINKTIPASNKRY